ncbi:GNAT family N-acetyltransferase [Kitasatospora atroaurantiaca]|uniref:CelD/BcsL family acetyltransferase involved in cellulose biosynthesis n=1 Tax=Kitasatospora atroaurantiaca TaxID=285545 RepID=A0A561EX19_9ACTN|nr:GNAT family N-acetyltransferase [Kitasatospora atroaurantiaca]TWE20165.1 CelD/BcsL family acetyltransferase involved in cellulose biosynthesis [Kitasatospora atroaurantiaca]
MTTETSAVGVPAQSAAPRWQTEVRRENDALDALAAEWDDLASRCPTATSFQAGAWVRSWWRHYGRPGALVVVLVRCDGRLVAAAALQRRGPFGGLTNLGGGLVDFTDVLLDDSCADRAAAELAGALPLHRPWHSLELREVHPEAAAQRVFRHWRGRRHRFDDSLCQYLPAVPMEELLKRLPGKTAQRSRVKQRKIAEADVEVRSATPEEVPEVVEELLRLHFLQWQERGVTAEHRTERFAAHLVESTTGLVATRRAALHRYWLDGEPVAVNLLLLCPSFGGLYMYGAHPALRERLDIAGLLFGVSLDEVRSAEIPVLSLLRGQEPYKQRWRPDQLHNQRLVLGPGRFAPFAAARAVRVRTRQAVVHVLRTRLPRLKEALVARRRS